MSNAFIWSFTEYISALYKYLNYEWNHFKIMILSEHIVIFINTFKLAR